MKPIIQDNSFAFFSFLAFQTVAMLSPIITQSMTGYGNYDMLNDTYSKYYAPSEHKWLEMN